MDGVEIIKERIGNGMWTGYERGGVKIWEIFWEDGGGRE